MLMCFVFLWFFWFIWIFYYVLLVHISMLWSYLFWYDLVAVHLFADFWLIDLAEIYICEVCLFCLLFWIATVCLSSFWIAILCLLWLMYSFGTLSFQLWEVVFVRFHNESLLGSLILMLILKNVTKLALLCANYHQLLCWYWCLMSWIKP